MLTLLGAPATGAAAVPNPTVTGPIGGAGLRGYALWDSWVDLAEYGYEEDEYFISGTATSPITASSTTNVFEAKWR